MPIAGLSPLQLSQPLVDRMLGVIYGNCLGDAFGLATEFCSKAEVARMYGAKYDPSTGAGGIPFPHERKTRHSSRWDHGDWTDDSDQMILILECMIEEPGALGHPVNPQLFASKLLRWVIKGFPELGDHAGMGLGALTHQVVSNKVFTERPFEAAQAAWERSGRKNAANGGVMRTSVAGVWEFFSPRAVQRNTKLMCQVTHADPRCLASCMLVTSLISALLRGDDDARDGALTTEAQVDAFIARHAEEAIAAVPQLAAEGHEATFRAHVARVAGNDIAKLELDDPSAIGYTLKCMASGLWGLRAVCAGESFASSITRLAREGGDADTNGAVCGALMGARLGYARLPADWMRALPNKGWLDAKLARFVPLVLERAQQANDAKSAGAASPVKSV